MCCVGEALGMCLPCAAAIPAPYNERLRLALQTGIKIVELVNKEITSRKIMTLESIKMQL